MLLPASSSSLQGNEFHHKDQGSFAGSAKTSNGLSLNDIFQVGATVQPDLYSTVLRFRTHQVCFTADIVKIYRQIVIHPQDRDLQRILWRYSSENLIQEYRLTTVTYGNSSAPFLVTRCLKKLADDNEQQYPRAAQVLSNDFYVDDLSGTSAIEDALNVQKELSACFKQQDFRCESGHLTTLHFWTLFHWSCKKQNQHYLWIMKMV